MIGPAINEMPVWRVICMNLIVRFKAQNQEITQTIPVQILREIKCIQHLAHGKHIMVCC